MAISAVTAASDAAVVPATRFAFKLFCQSVADTQKENVVLSQLAKRAPGLGYEGVKPQSNRRSLPVQHR